MNLAGVYGRRRDVEERDDRAPVRELFAQLGFCVLDGEDSASVQGEPLPAVFERLGWHRRGQNFVVGVLARIGKAGRNRKEIIHRASVAHETRALSDYRVSLRSVFEAALNGETLTKMPQSSWW